MMRTNTFRRAVAVLCFFAVAALASPLFAQSPVLRATGKPTVFKVTVTKVELYNGTSFVTVFTGSAQLDLVAAAGASSFPGIADLSIPRGTYTQIRVTFLNQFGIRGSIPFGGTTWYVTSTVVPDTGGAAAQGSADPALAGEAAILNPDWGALGAAVSQTVTIPSITVTSSTDYQPTLKFDVANALALWEQGGVSHYLTLQPITISIL